MGADIKLSVSLIEVNGIRNETGLMTKKVERRKRASVAIEEPLILDMVGGDGLEEIGAGGHYLKQDSGVAVLA